MKYLLLVLLWATLPVSLHAQNFQSLIFPAQASVGADKLSRGTAFGKPAGDGPFPALIFLQTCDGTSADQTDWGRRAIAHGYATMVVDSMGPRNISSQNCNLPIPVRADDALAARAHLEKFSFIDKSRIGVVGFSAGGTAAARLGVDRGPDSPALRPFAAIVAFYPACVRRDGDALIDNFSGTKRNGPLLVLLGDKDPQARVSECVPQLEYLKAAGFDVDWRVYPGVTHCFDCKSSSGKTAYDDLHRGRMSFIYDANATSDAEQRTFAFFAAKMGGVNKQ